MNVIPLYLKDVTKEERDELRKQKEYKDMLKRIAEGVFSCSINPDVASHVHDAMSDEAFRAHETTISEDFSRLPDSVRELSINVQNICGINHPHSVETAVGSMMMSTDREVGFLFNMIQDEILKSISSSAKDGAFR